MLKMIDVYSGSPRSYATDPETDITMIKATQGTGYVNPMCNTDWDAAKNAGKLLGLYHYAGGEDAVDEANYFIASIKNYVGQAVLAVDWESNQNNAWGDTSWCRRFVDRVHELTGVWPLVYVSQSAINQVANCVDTCGLWVARYANNQPLSWDYKGGDFSVAPWKTFTIHQFTGTDMDRNMVNTDREGWLRLAKGGNTGSTGGTGGTPGGDQGGNTQSPIRVLQLKGRFDSSGVYSASQQQGVPAWRTAEGGINNKANWWGGPNTDENEAFYWSLVDNHAYIQYGKNQSAWAGCRVIDENLTWTNERQNPDGSVDCDVTLDIGDYWGRTTDYFRASVPVVHTVKVGDQTVTTYSGGTGDAFQVAANPNRVTKHIRVNPQSYSDAIQLYIDVHYPTGVFPDAHFDAGLTLYNPTPPAYIPMATRKSGQWLNLNDHNGHILIRHGNWQDKSKELFTTQRQENQGHNRIRRAGKWLQLPKM